MDVRQFSSDKILKHLDRVNEWLRGGNPPPVTVELDLTNVCNHRCPECTGNYLQSRSAVSLPPQLARRIIREIAQEGVRGLIFTGGGDPLCYPKVKEMVAFASRQDLDIGFITNGTLLTKPMARALLTSCRWIRVSLDAASPAMFARMHGMGPAAFTKTLSNIRMLTRLKKQMRSRTTVGVGFLTNSDTVHEMPAMTALAKRLGVDYLQFRPLQLHRHGVFTYDRLDIGHEFEECVKQETASFKVLCSLHKYEMMNDKNFGRNYGKCYGHQFVTVVSADAKMYICCHMRGLARYCIGDLRRHSFRQIWHSRRRRSVVNGINFCDCVPLCRDNTFNQILWNIAQGREHVNFL